MTTITPKSAFEEVFIFVAEDIRLDLEASPTSAAVAMPDASRLAAALVGEAPAPILAAPTTDLRPSLPLAASWLRRACTITSSPTRSTIPSSRSAGTRKVAVSRAGAGAWREAGTAADMDAVSIDGGGIGTMAAGTMAVGAAAAENIARLTSALREAMMGIRMVPVGTLFSRSRRLIHDLARHCGKTIDFVTGGDETEIDKTMISVSPIRLCTSSATPPITDWSTRPPAARQQGGDGTHRGRRPLRRHRGAAVDPRRRPRPRRATHPAQSGGAGPRPARRRALGCRALPAHLRTRLLHGEGGLGAVEPRRRHGRRQEDHREHALLNRHSHDGGRGHHDHAAPAADAGDHRGAAGARRRQPLCVQLVDVEECVELSGSDYASSKGRSFLNVRGDLIPFLRLREVFAEESGPNAFQKVIIVANGDMRVGLVVDQIIGSHQTVIMSLSKLHADVSSFSDATILGDGSVALILDIPPGHRARPHARDAPQHHGDRLMLAQTEIETMAILRTIAQAAGKAIEQGWHLVVLHHTDCGIIGCLHHAPDLLAKHLGVTPAGLAVLTISDPYKAVALNVAALKASPDLPGGAIVTGLVYDVATGRIETVVPPAVLRAEMA